MLRLDYLRQSSKASSLHDLDARVKLVLLLVMLVGLASLRSPSLLQVFSYLLFVLLTASFARSSITRLVFTSMLAFPFVGFFALLIYLAGDVPRAWAILAKSYLSTLTVLVCVTITPLPDLLSAATFFKFPQFLLGITQIIYRYLFVLTEQVRTMQIAFQARGGHKRRLAVLASSGMVAVLFSRSYQKAIVVDHAMLSRGYSGSLPVRSFGPLRYRELGALVLGFSFVIGLQFIS